MNWLSTWRSRVGACMAATALIVGANVSVGAQSNGEDFTVEAAIDLTQGPPGTVVQVAGRCTDRGTASDRVLVGIYHMVSPGDTPYDVYKDATPPATDGTWSIAFTVPLEMPLGPARFSVLCATDDVVLPAKHLDFLVTEPEPLPPTPVVRPRSGTPRYTG